MTRHSFLSLPASLPLVGKLWGKPAPSEAERPHDFRPGPGELRLRISHYPTPDEVDSFGIDMLVPRDYLIDPAHWNEFVEVRLRSAFEQLGEEIKYRENAPVSCPLPVEK